MVETTDQTAAPAVQGFLKELIKQWRAQDLHGSWDKKSDLDLLEPYILTKEKRREIPIMSDPDPETLWRMELFYNAVGLTIERATGVMVSPLFRLHHEGFGRLVLTAGRLIVLNKNLREAKNWQRLAWNGSKSIRKSPAIEGGRYNRTNHSLQAEGA